MSIRLLGFDYSRPYYYMVTIRRRPRLAPFSGIVAPGRCEMNAVTRAFVNCIRNFHLACAAVAPITCFSVMPDHVHLLIHLVENEQRLRLETVVGQLMAALEGRWQEVTKRREEVFEAGWHDWIVTRRGQLADFTRYIRENPARRFLRLSHPEYFRHTRPVDFLGRTWQGYGNDALLRLPVIMPFRCSRSWAPDGPEWTRAVARAARIGPGGAGIGTFMSPCEKACGHALGLAGGRWIVLSPDGFGPRWHPGREFERFCAEGRMLFLSLYEARAARLTAGELYDRCHEMGDWVAARLGGGGVGEGTTPR